MHRSFTRREFVASAAAGLAAPVVIARPGLAASRRVVANDRIAVGLIGCGKRMFEIVGPLANHPDLQVTWVCDVDTTRRERCLAVVNDIASKASAAGDAGKGGNGGSACRACVDYHEMLQEPSLDAVVICTPDHWHVNPVLDAAAAGKDIYCEKPLTLTLAEGKLMMDAVRKHKRVFQTGSQQRTEYDHKFVTACELVRSGRIGKVLTVHVGVADPPVPCDLPEESTEPGLEWDRWLGPAPARPYHSELSPRGMHNHYPRWRRYSEYSGGYLADMGAHHFDIAQWGLGRDTSGPVRVESPKDEKALRGATLIYDDGVRLVHGGPSGTTFIGTDGVIAVDRGRLHSVSENILKDTLPESAPRLPRHKDHLQNWVDCMRSRERCICDVEVGARSAAVCHLANLAYRERRVLTWDPTAWTFRAEADPSRLMDHARRAAYALPRV